MMYVHILVNESADLGAPAIGHAGASGCTAIGAKKQHRDKVSGWNV